MKWNELFREACARVGGSSRLAPDLFVSRTTAWRWESGLTEPSRLDKVRTKPVLDSIVSHETRIEGE